MAYGYTDTKWKDLLKSYDGQAITYDAIGNPLSYYNGNTYTLTWSHGRQLTQLSKQQTISPLVATYTYDESGLRTSKTVGSATTEYHWDGNLLVGTTGQYGTLQFLYDGGSQPYGVLWNGVPYYYVYNGQGDVVRIVDEDGATKVIYTYDAWGRQLSQKNANGNSIPSYATSEIANANPLRYRGYIYDIESGFYYLQSRYYDPTTGRFINGDGQINADMLGPNLFAYCGNNPVSRVDSTGRDSEEEEEYIFSSGTSRHMSRIIGRNRQAVTDARNEANVLDDDPTPYGFYVALLSGGADALIGAQINKILPKLKDVYPKVGSAAYKAFGPGFHLQKYDYSTGTKVARGISKTTGFVGAAIYLYDIGQDFTTYGGFTSDFGKAALVTTGETLLCIAGGMICSVVHAPVGVVILVGTILSLGSDWAGTQIKQNWIGY